MYRSFTDRVFGGVCGGVAVRLPINAWMLRGLFVVFTVASLGTVGLLYLGLWWIIPQESLIEARNSGPLVVLGALLLTLLLVGAWVGHLSGVLRGPDDQALLLPVALLILSIVFFLRQV